MLLCYPTNFHALIFHESFPTQLYRNGRFRTYILWYTICSAFHKNVFDLKVNCWRQSITKLTCIKSFKNINTVSKFFFIVLCTHTFHFYIQHPLLELFCCRICVMFFIKHPEQGNSIYKNVLAETKNIRELSSTFLQKPIIWKFAK